MVDRKVLVSKTTIVEKERRKGVYCSPFALFLLTLLILGSIAAVITLAVLFVARGAEIAALQKNDTTPTTPPLTTKCNTTLTGQVAIRSTWKDSYPGLCRQLTLDDLPEPDFFNVTTNDGKPVPRPPGAMPKVPPGFKISLFSSALTEPRIIRVAPNGDLFVSESRFNRTSVIRAVNGVVQNVSDFTGEFISNMNYPFGVAFYPLGENPEWVYIANQGEVLRFPYRNGDLKASGAPQVVVSGLPVGGHVSKDVIFSRDGSTMFGSVGSGSNVHEDPTVNETNRAIIWESKPDGSAFRVFASGIRNPVGLAINPTTGELWTSVNERDDIGDYLVPDYITHVTNNSFFGWPWYYMGPEDDPRHLNTTNKPFHKNQTTTPDVILQSHSASLQMEFYTGRNFPAEYHGDAFAAEHGSWNRKDLTGYKVIRVPMGADGKALGEYQDFVTGFITEEGHVWGRPVGVATDFEGALLVTDDQSNSIWRVTYEGSA